MSAAIGVLPPDPGAAAPQSRRARRRAESAAMKKGSRGARIAIISFLVVAAALWMVPLLWAFYTSLRPLDYFKDHSYFSIGGPYNFQNYADAWVQAELPKFFKNSMIITLPAVALTLLLASFAAFKLSRMPWRYNIPLLILFTAGNLLPQQVLATPLFQMAKHTPLPESVSRLRIVHQHLLHRDRRQRGVPTGLLHLRDEQLHEGTAG